MEFFNDVGADPLKPSLFELVAQEQLRDLLQPALKYVLSVFAQRYPRYLLRIVNKHEECYALFMLVVERHYLRKHGASFSENFYGLKRRRRPYIEPERAKVATGGVPEAEKLRSREIRRSLLFLVGLPYLRAKAQDYYEELGGGDNSDILDEGMDARQLRALTDQSYKGWLRRAFKAAYPWLNTSFEVWLLVCNVAYLFDQTPFYRPWLSWIGVDLRRLGLEDFRAASLSAGAKIPQAKPKGILFRFRRLISTSPHLLFDSLRLLLPTAIFFIKFLEWWYSPNSPARSLSVSPLGPAVPPPHLLLPHTKGIGFDQQSYGICPLCHKEINNATALPSGYVFCYRCAYDHVEKHGEFKITRKIKRTLQKSVVEHQVAERQKWEKFGAERGNARGPDRATTTVGENVYLTLSAGNKSAESEQQEEKKPVKSTTGGKVVCRLCKGDHFTAKCPYRDTLGGLENAGDTGAGPDDDTVPPPDAASGAGPTGSKYIPPSLRAGARGTGETMRGPGGGNRDDLPTLRVTNISEDTQENDLRDLFGHFGRVARVYVGRDRDTGAGKGFAFVSFEDRAVAQKAMEKVNGKGYDNLILSVQWSQPRADPK